MWNACKSDSRNNKPPITNIWLVFCCWDKPYFIENQQELLGAFSTREKAEERVKRHEEYAAADWEHSRLDCTCACFAVPLDKSNVAEPG